AYRDPDIPLVADGEPTEKRTAHGSAVDGAAYGPPRCPIVFRAPSKSANAGSGSPACSARLRFRSPKFIFPGETNRGDPSTLSASRGSANTRSARRTFR